MKKNIYLFLIAATVLFSSSGHSQNPSQIADGLATSEMLAHQDLLNQYDFIIKEMKDDLYFPKAPQIAAVWFFDQPDLVSKNCSGKMVAEWYFNLDSNAKYKVYRVGLVPQWLNSTCIYRIEKQLLESALDLLMGSQSFTKIELSKYMKLSVKDIQLIIIKSYPTFKVSGMALQSPLPPQEPPLYFRVQGFACKGLPTETEGEFYIQAITGKSIQDEWVPKKCQ